MKNDNSLSAEMYQQTGISQQALAIFIDTKQSTLSHFDAGTRSLPTEALLQLAELYNMVNSLPQPANLQPAMEEATILQEQANWCRVQCQPLQKQLKAMKLCRQQSANMLSLLEAYTTGNKSLTKKKQRWVEEQRYRAEKKSATNGWLVQQQLSIKIAVLTREATLCEAAALTL